MQLGKLLPLMCQAPKCQSVVTSTVRRTYSFPLVPRRRALSEELLSAEGRGPGGCEEANGLTLRIQRKTALALALACFPV